MPGQREIITSKVALEKAMRFCAYQERSQMDVRKKLLEWGVDEATTEGIIAELITENFLSEERFTEAFINGKLKIKHWGRKKIIQGLKLRQVSEYSIREGMNSIDEAEYLQILEEEFCKKNNTFSNPLTFENKGKIARYLIQKGFEPELVWQKIKEREHGK